MLEVDCEIGGKIYCENYGTWHCKHYCFWSNDGPGLENMYWRKTQKEIDKLDGV